MFNRYILVIGGLCENEILASAIYLEAAETQLPTADWQAMPPMLGGRFDHTACELYGRVFVAAGTRLSTRLHDVEMFISANDYPLCSDAPWTPKQGQWTQVNNLNQPCVYNSVSFGYGDKLYLGTEVCKFDLVCLKGHVMYTNSTRQVKQYLAGTFSRQTYAYRGRACMR